MSTFDGIVAEFPDIRVDFFRHNPARPPPLACFLSHVHSDHLAGLETLKAPFVYCSAATREMLLLLERYPCRINHAKGVLEARVQTYKHLKNLLKPIPLGTPTMLVLRPGREIRITLLDANHCPGAAMFLFESSTTAVLYTGDLRSEPWFVNSIARNPCLLEYTCGIRTLDKIYLDTSFSSGSEFQTKAQGVAELLRKVLAYPRDTIFHLQAWTFGYEDVWVVLAKALGSRIHVDEYKMRLYTSLVSHPSGNSHSAPHVHHLSAEASALVGFMCGNTYHPGCLTRDENVRLHSCEKGNYCDVVKNSPVVWIQPVVARLPEGGMISELGVGGGGDDLEREPELEQLSLEETDVLMNLISKDESLSLEDREAVREFLLNKTADGRNISLNMDMASFGDENETTLERAADSIAKISTVKGGPTQGTPAGGFPRRVNFPYSRHSSYPELCAFVEAFKPRDVWPCTVNPAEWMSEGKSIRSLFGQHCTGDTFDHDLKMEVLETQMKLQVDSQVTSQNADSQRSLGSLDISERSGGMPSPPRLPPRLDVSATDGTIDQPIAILDDESNSPSQIERIPQPEEHLKKRDFKTYTAEDGSQESAGSQASARVSWARTEAYNTMMRNLLGSGEGGWEGIPLISTGHGHSRAEPELGDG